MRKRMSKVLCLLVAAFMFTTFFSSCKGKGNDDPSQTAVKSASAKKSSSAAKSSTSTKSAGTATNKQNSSTNKNDSTIANADGSQSGNSAGSGEVNSSNNDQSGNDSNGQSGGDAGYTNPTEAKIDLGGRKFVVASRDALPDPETADIIGKVSYNSYMAAQEKYNLVFEYKYVPGGTDVIANEFVNASLAGIQYADVIALATKQAFPRIAENNYIAPIDDYVDFNNPLYNTTYMKTVGLWKDKHYGFTRPVYSGTSGVFFNKDIFETQGLPNPYDLFRNGSWNWESFLQIGQQATRDLNGDGIIDQWGIEMHKSDYHGVAFLASNGVQYFDYIDGKVQFMLNDPKAVRALQFMSDLINTYKVATTQLSSGGFKQGGSAMYIGDLLASPGGYRDAGINFGFIMPPQGPDVSAPQTINAGGHIWAFPTNANLSEAIPVFMDMLTIWDPSKPEHVTYNDYLYAYLVGKGYSNEDDIAFLMQYCSDPVISLYQSMPDLGKLVSKEVFEKIVKLETTPAAALDAVQENAQQIIDSYIETQ